MKRILVAGSTGYLGSHIVKELVNRKMDFKAIVRNENKAKHLNLNPTQIIQAQVTDATALKGICAGVEVVISTIGITRQKDDLTYMDVDYRANKNLLDEAIKSGVKKFIYISVLHGEHLKHLRICEAKERFVQVLEDSGLEYCIIRPSGFFSDMGAFYDMAKQGRVYLFGDGSILANPIHGEDLAKVCVDSIFQKSKCIEVGGPEVCSHRDIAELAFRVLDKKPKITYIPDWIRKISLKLSAIFMSKSRFGPIEFFLHVMAMDMCTNSYGNQTLKDFFIQKHNS